jgi:lactoylglutathione lyase
MLRTSGIDHLNLQVIKLSESVEFYSRLFGFKILKEEREYDGAIIGNDRVKLCLYEDPDFKGYKKNGMNHFCLHVENFDEILEACKKQGVKVNYGGIVPWEKSDSVYIEDPNGYEIELSRVWGGGLGIKKT